MYISQSFYFYQTSLVNIFVTICNSIPCIGIIPLELGYSNNYYWQIEYV